MKLSAGCMRCLIDSQESKIEGKGTEAERAAYLKEVMRLVVEAGEEDSVPCLVSEANRLYEKTFGGLQDFGPVKREFNELVLKIEPEIREKINGARDPLREALKYARLGNFIDFGVFAQVDPKELMALLETASEDTLEEPVYQAFLQEMETAGKVVWLHDNCGEIVLDKLVLELLQARFPKAQFCSLVRQFPIYNDATMEDAVQSGLTQVVEVRENGTDVAGTPLHRIGEEAAALLREADVIIAKGQGNFETMYGCGLPVYYLFLCKCDWFCKRFHAVQNQGMFLREQELSFLEA